MDFGRRPLQTVQKVFELRNRVVHPKAEVAEGEYTSAEKLPKPAWEKSSTIQLAHRAIEDFKILIYDELGGIDIE